MDPQLITLAQEAMLTLAPLIAGGALAKVGEETTNATKQLAQRLWAQLTRTAQGSAEAEAALTLYQARPQDAGRQTQALAALVPQLATQPAGVQELIQLLAEARQAGLLPSPPSRSHTLTVSGGTVGVAISGDAHGPITLGQEPRPPQQ